MKLWLEDREGVCIVATEFFSNLESPLSKQDTESLLDCFADRVKLGVWNFDGSPRRFSQLFEDASEAVGSVQDFDILHGFSEVQKGVVHAMVLEEIADAARNAFRWNEPMEPIDDQVIIERVIDEVRGHTEKNAEVAA